MQAMPIFYMGQDWEARIHERMCFFKVNGVKGWGISEWDYRYNFHLFNYIIFPLVLIQYKVSS